MSQDDKEYEVYRSFKAEVEVARGWIQDIELNLQMMGTSPQYDEPYKLGPNPDIEAIKEATEHLKQAQEKLAKFFDSTTNYPT
jgi:hypothetical protein